MTAAGLDWRQVTVLRAYLRYWLQGRTSLSPADLADPLVAYPEVARGLIGYFQARFDPARRRSCAIRRTARRTRWSSPLPRRAGPGSPLQQDQVLRGYLR